MRLFVVIVLFAVVGCANNPGDECGGKVLLLWPTAAGDFKFQAIQLTTLKSPYELKGAAAEVFYDARITDSGFNGPVARPNLTRSGGGVCVPTDVASSQSLAAYAHIEQLYKFDLKLDVAQQLSWPRKVGVDIKLFSSEGLSHSNAHYFGRSDSMAVVPYSQGGLPMGLNPGILGHEHFHAHFQSQVNNVVSERIAGLLSVEDFFYMGFGIKPRVEDLGFGVVTVEGLNKFVLRSWNEGLADFYGAVYSQKSDFFSVSMPKLGPFRDVALPPRQMKSGKGLADDANSLDSERNDMIATSYNEGSNLARLMYKIAQSGSIAPEALLKQILERLKRVAGTVTPMFRQQVMDFETIVPDLIEGIQLNPAACAAVKDTLSKEMLVRSFSQCGL